MLDYALYDVNYELFMNLHVLIIQLQICHLNKQSRLTLFATSRMALAPYQEQITHFFPFQSIFPFKKHQMSHAASFEKDNTTSRQRCRAV